jgi:hypothetical protein
MRNGSRRRQSRTESAFGPGWSGDVRQAESLIDEGSLLFDNPDCELGTRCHRQVRSLMTGPRSRPADGHRSASSVRSAGHVVNACVGPRTRSQPASDLRKRGRGRCCSGSVGYPWDTGPVAVNLPVTAGGSVRVEGTPMQNCSPRLRPATQQCREPGPADIPGSRLDPLPVAVGPGAIVHGSARQPVAGRDLDRIHAGGMERSDTIRPRSLQGRR